MKIIRLDKTEGHFVYKLFDQYRVFYKQPSDLEEAKKFIQQRLDNNESVIFVALATGSEQPIGFTQLYPIFSSVRIAKNWLLNDLYVSLNFRKKGIGESLLHRAIDFGKENNARFVELLTAVDNLTAQRLYEQFGFKKLAPDIDHFTYRINMAK